MRAWLRWLKSEGITSGPVFRQLSTGDRLTERARSTGPEARLSPAAIGERIKVLATNAHIKKPAAITSQGVRAGAATDLAAAGVSGKHLARAGLWKENSAIPEAVYVRPLQDATDDPFAVITAVDPGALA